MDAFVLPALNLPITTFEHARDAAPKPANPTLRALIAALTTFRVLPVADKRELPAWSPATFAGDRRVAREVIAVSCVVLDLDDSGVDATSNAWADALHVVHTTWSHTAERPRWRLVAPLARPIPAEGWPAAWAWAEGRTPGVDPSCKDPGRIYFVPAIPSDDRPHDARVHAGPVLDLLARLPPPPAITTPRPRPRLRVPARLWAAAARRRLAEEPASRLRFAGLVGATVVGDGDARRAEDVACPACGRPSVWFWIAPNRQTSARCQHRQSCGWRGALLDLTGGAS
jgi:hypothetical protein